LIPALHAQLGPSSLTLEYLGELRLRGFDGDIAHAHADRTVFATDNSIYQLAPQAVIFPRHEVDVIRVAKLAREARFAR